MTPDQALDLLSPQAREAVRTGSTDAYDPANADHARPHNVAYALKALGIWGDGGTLTAFGRQVADILRDRADTAPDADHASV